MIQINRTLVLAASVAALAVLAGCGKGDNADTGPIVTPPKSEAPAAPGTVQRSQRMNQLSPNAGQSGDGGGSTDSSTFKGGG